MLTRHFACEKYCLHDLQSATGLTTMPDWEDVRYEVYDLFEGGMTADQIYLFMTREREFNES